MPAAHDHVAAEAERLLRDALRDDLADDRLADLARLWHDFAAHTDLGRTRKPETWAAALLYTYDRLQLGGLSQGEAAGLFDVSALSVSQKFRQIAEALDLRLLDARYLTEARRAALRRDYPNLPEDLPLTEAPTSFWHLPFAFRTFGPEGNAFDRAQDLVYDGWEALSEGDEARAARGFRAALDADPTLADAHNGLAALADDPAAAEAEYRRAYALARDALASEAPHAYHWWGELETRPYMRARAGLGHALAEQGRYHEAAAEYEALLALNPNDNQGLRYLIGPTYLLAGDLDVALRAFDEYERAYPDDSGDPHHRFCHGLARWAAGQPREAGQAWAGALFSNLYVAPLLLGEPLPPTDLWHGTNLAWPDYAAEYVERYGALWSRHEGAREALRRLYHAPTVQERRRRWIEIGQDLHRLSENRPQGSADPTSWRTKWVGLVHEQWALRDVPLDPATRSRVTAAPQANGTEPAG